MIDGINKGLIRLCESYLEKDSTLNEANFFKTGFINPNKGEHFLKAFDEIFKKYKIDGVKSTSDLGNRLSEALKYAYERIADYTEKAKSEQLDEIKNDLNTFNGYIDKLSKRKFDDKSDILSFTKLTRIISDKIKDKFSAQELLKYENALTAFNGHKDINTAGIKWLSAYIKRPLEMTFSNAKPITVHESEKSNQSNSMSNTNKNIKQNTISASNKDNLSNKDRLLKAVENKELTSDDLVRLAVNQMSDKQVNQLLKSAANLKSSRKGK